MIALRERDIPDSHWARIKERARPAAAPDGRLHLTLSPAGLLTVECLDCGRTNYLPVLASRGWWADLRDRLDRLDHRKCRARRAEALRDHPVCHL